MHDGAQKQNPRFIHRIDFLDAIVKFVSQIPYFIFLLAFTTHAFIPLSEAFHLRS